jgi:hypothetical protein
VTRAFPVSGGETAEDDVDDDDDGGGDDEALLQPAEVADACDGAAPRPGRKTWGI